MKVYKYFNSEKVAGFCAKNNTQFDAMETAFIVWLSNSKTIGQKHSAYKEIIKSMPNINAYKYDINKKTHVFLKDYMKIEDILLNIFFDEGEDKVYSILKRYTAMIDDRVGESEGEYHTFDELIKNLPDTEESIMVEKLAKLPGEDDYFNEVMMVEMTREGKVIRVIKYDKSLLTDEQNKIYGAFKEAKVKIPVPFKKGDLLRIKLRNNSSFTFLLDKLYGGGDDNYDWEDMEDYDDCVINSNLILEGYSCTESGTIYYCQIPHTFNMVPCSKDLEKHELFLKSVGNYNPKLNDDKLMDLIYLLEQYDDLRKKC